MNCFLLNLQENCTLDKIVQFPCNCELTTLLWYKVRSELLNQTMRFLKHLEFSWKIKLKFITNKLQVLFIAFDYFEINEMEVLFRNFISIILIKLHPFSDFATIK